MEKHGQSKDSLISYGRSNKWIFQAKQSILEEFNKVSQGDQETSDPDHKFPKIGSVPLDNMLYEGEWDDRQMSGFGICYYSSKLGGGFDVRYSGEFKKSCREGKGKMIWGSGDSLEIYDGHWEKGRRSGTGSFFWNSGDSYCGEWVSDLKSGQGTLQWNNGNKYVGLWDKELKRKGTMYEAASGRTVEADNIDFVLDKKLLHPEIEKSIEQGTCTSQFTGNKCYFQYLWQTNSSSDRIHGVCMACKETCVPANGYELRNPGQFFFGGNFYCDCGTGRLGGKCHAKH
jgi:hypothetical protein